MIDTFFKENVFLDMSGKVSFLAGLLTGLVDWFGGVDINNVLTITLTVLGIFYTLLRIIGWFQTKKKPE